MITLDSTVREAKEWLREKVKGDGANCPVCHQFAKVWRTKIDSRMARSLILLYNASEPGEYIHIPTVLRDLGARGNETKLRFWGLLQELEVQPDADGNRRAGWWKVTATGRLFVERAAKVQSHALLFDNRCLGLDGELIDINDALGSKFSWAELMAPAVAS